MTKYFHTSSIIRPQAFGRLKFIFINTCQPVAAGKSTVPMGKLSATSLLCFTMKLPFDVQK